jgi:dCMP deaminase
MTAQRPPWDQYFMGIALEVAKRSTCLRAKVGAIIVRDKRILTTGYNGSPSGLPHCTEVGCLMANGHCVRTLHAEQNAIIQAALHGVSVSGGTIYVTHQPCLTCAKMIINAGIRRVIYGGHYPDELAVSFLEQAGVELAHLGDVGEG